MTMRPAPCTMLLVGALALLVAPARGQLPTACVDSAGIPLTNCCPESKFSTECAGGTLNGKSHGKCVDKGDFNSLCAPWFQPFGRLCKCEPNWAGPSCEQCAPGYYDDGDGKCNKKVMRHRTEWFSLSKSQQNSFLSAVLLMKEDTKRYVWPPGHGANSGKPISTYDAFALLHVLAIKGDGTGASYPNENTNYAHGASAFPTWHREYLLKFESELHLAGMDREMGIPFWDWTRDDAMSIFDPATFGGDGDKNNNNAISSGLFRRWEVVQANSTIMGPITRDFMSDPTATTLPTAVEVAEVLTEEVYDKAKWDLEVDNTFRNKLEGFQVTSDNQIMRGIHNRVHVLVGGTMGDVSVSANDPIFWLHHANVDRIFEMWLSDHPDLVKDGYIPSGNSEYVGHNAHECMVPFFPPVTNAERFVTADSKGRGLSYKYVSSASGTNVAILPGILAVLCLFL